MDILDIFPNIDPKQHKVHFARQGTYWDNVTGKREWTPKPLDVYDSGPDEWLEWQSYRPVYNCFNRKFVFALCQYYHKPGLWLFAGIFHVLQSYPYPTRYDVRLTKQGRAYDGNLLLDCVPPPYPRTIRANLDNYFDRLVVVGKRPSRP